jgi:hypothetical protein
MPPKPPPPPPPRKPAHLTSPAPIPAQRSQKKGLAWPWDHKPTLFPLLNPQPPTWLFNWELWSPEGLPPQTEFVPTVRTAPQARDVLPFLADQLSNKPQLRIGALLGFNEPEIASQANMGVDEAVRLWRETCVEARRRWGLRLGSPGISSDWARSAPWLDAFLVGLGAGERPDFVVVHWYGREWREMRAFLERVWQRWGLRVWVNEFACSAMGDGEVGVDEARGFLDEAVPWLEQCEWVERFAYFGMGQGMSVGEWVGRGSDFLIDAPEAETEGKALSELGKRYLQM